MQKIYPHLLLALTREYLTAGGFVWRGHVNWSVRDAPLRGRQKKTPWPSATRVKKACIKAFHSLSSLLICSCRECFGWLPTAAQRAALTTTNEPEIPIQRQAAVEKSLPHGRNQDRINRHSLLFANVTLLCVKKKKKKKKRRGAGCVCERDGENGSGYLLINSDTRL